MRKSTDLDTLAILEEVAPHDVSTCSDASIAILRRGPAENDATREYPAITKDEIESWAQHARAANGLVDLANGLVDLETTATTSAARPASYYSHQSARPQRSFALGEIIAAAIQAAGAIARRAHARHRQRRQARVSTTLFGGSMTARCAISASTAAK